MAEKIAFYSYKGGVGRSMLLANAAVLLTQLGKRVVCIDFDLEASGLHTIFKVQPPRNIDLISVLLGSTTTEAMLNLSHLVPDRSPEGELFLLPTLSESMSLQSLSECRADDIRSQITRVHEEIIGSINPHYILMDCRTGMADTSFLGIQQADTLVCVLRPNKQNVNGLKLLLDVLDRQGRPHLLVVSQVPNIKNIDKKLAILEDEMGGNPKRKFGVTIPLLPELALGEEIAAISMRNSLSLKHYNMVVNWIVDRKR